MLELFETPLTVLHIFVCFFLILVVLIQPGKSGGLGAALGGAGATQVFGGRGAGNFLSKATWACASTFFLTSIVLAYISSSADDSLEDRSVAVVPAKEAESDPAAGKAANEAPAEPAAAGEPAPENAAAAAGSAAEVNDVSEGNVANAEPVTPGAAAGEPSAVVPSPPPADLRAPVRTAPATVNLAPAAPTAAKPTTPVVPSAAVPRPPVVATPVVPAAAKPLPPVVPMPAKSAGALAPAPVKPTTPAAPAPATPAP
jgi:preprotein translocase subunit SecG